MQPTESTEWESQGLADITEPGPHHVLWQSDLMFLWIPKVGVGAVSDSFPHLCDPSPTGLSHAALM